MYIGKFVRSYLYRYVQTIEWFAFTKHLSLYIGDSCPVYIVYCCSQMTGLAAASRWLIATPLCPQPSLTSDQRLEVCRDDVFPGLLWSAKRPLALHVEVEGTLRPIFFRSPLIMPEPSEPRPSQNVHDAFQIHLPQQHFTPLSPTVCLRTSS